MNRTYIYILFLFFSIQAAFSQTASFVADTTVGCGTLSVRFTNTSEYTGTPTWQWEFGDGQVSTEKNPIHNYDTVGLSKVKLSMKLINDTRNYSATDTIFVRPKPNPFFTYSDEFNMGHLMGLFTSSEQSIDSINYKYSWSVSSSSHILGRFRHASAKYGNRDTMFYLFDDAGLYRVSLRMTDYLGCTDSMMLPFRISDQFEVPNVFTPNGDGINDFFIVPTNGHIVYTFTVYSRTGSLVYKTTTPTIMWDGRNNNGEKISSGTYLIMIEPKGDSSQKTFTGFINIFGN
jgi:gliding motility-associated-like protein